MKILLCVCCLNVAVAQAQSSEGLLYLPAAKLKGYSSSLKAKQPTVSGNKKSMLASEQLANRGNHSAMVIRRDESGEPEVHVNWADVHIGQDGEATIVYGGKVEGGRETGPGEIRGGKIVGGTTLKLGPGDVALIPAGMPHQTTVEKGKSVTVLIFKIEKK